MVNLRDCLSEVCIALLLNIILSCFYVTRENNSSLQETGNYLFIPFSKLHFTGRGWALVNTTNSHVLLRTAFAKHKSAYTIFIFDISCRLHAPIAWQSQMLIFTMDSSIFLRAISVMSQLFYLYYFIYFLRDLFYFMCMSDSLTCLSVYHVHASCPQILKRTVGVLQLKLQTFRSFQVHTEYQTQVLFKNKCSKLLSHVSSHFILGFDFTNFICFLLLKSREKWKTQLQG